MDKKMNQIECPNCGTTINVEDVLSHQIEDKLRNQYESEYNEKLKIITNREKALKESEKKQQEIIEQELEKREKDLRSDIDKQYKTDYEKKLSSLSSDLSKKEKELLALKDAEIELERLKREKGALEKDYQLKLEKEKTKIQQETEERIIRSQSEKHALELKEKDKKLEDAMNQVAEMERKLKQGSMQLQGEVQELAIEAILKEIFPDDEIKPVPKGKTGADCILFVNAGTDETAGKIIYESKRTKAFSNSWLEKLKTDQRVENADIAVLVTQTLPKEIENIGIIDGIWVCSYGFIKPLSIILHDGLLRIAAFRNTQKNSGDKMQMLYDFLTSNEFKMQIEAILEGFLNLKQSMDKEKLAMEKIWKEREKQLNKVLTNTTQFYGSIKGIAGAGVPEIPMLEFGGE